MSLMKGLKVILYTRNARNKMPLTKKGEKILGSFKKRYGIIKGQGFFYAYIKKHPGRTKEWHRQ